VDKVGKWIMENLAVNFKGERIIVAFMTSGGGGNHKKVTYLGEKTIQDLVSLRDGDLFERDGVYFSPMGDEMDCEVYEDGTGYLDFDGSYDTVNSCFLDTCDEDSLRIIANSGEWLSSEIQAYIKQQLQEEGEY
jgi:hypothetical protein